MMVRRMMRAAQLDARLYEEVEHDPTLTGEAGLVVAVVAAAQGLGAALETLQTHGPLAAGGAFLVGLVMPVLGWVLWSYITWFVGTSLFQGTAEPGELMRTLGYAQTPNLLGILRFVPFLGVAAVFVAALWTLVAGVIAVRQALDFDTPRAVVTVVIGWVVLLCLTCTTSMVFGAGAAVFQRAF